MRRCPIWVMILSCNFAPSFKKWTSVTLVIQPRKYWDAIRIEQQNTALEIDDIRDVAKVQSC